jgi:hypothetical protein
MKMKILCVVSAAISILGGTSLASAAKATMSRPAALTTVALAYKLDPIEAELLGIREEMDRGAERHSVLASEVARSLGDLGIRLRQVALRIAVKAERRAALVRQVSDLQEMLEEVDRKLALEDIDLHDDLGRISVPAKALERVAQSLEDTIRDLRDLSPRTAIAAHRGRRGSR